MEDELMDAVRYGDIKEVIKLIKDDADVNCKNKWGDTSLHIVGSNLEIAELLIDNGADVNAQNNHGRTPLHQTICNYNFENGHLEMAKLLIERGVNISIKDYSGTIALDLAKQEGNCKIVELIENSKQTINSKLLIAAKKGAIDEIIGLLNRGVNINVQYQSGETALHEAIQYNHTEVVKLLVNNGIDINAKEDRRGKTALYTACEEAYFKRHPEYLDCKQARFEIVQLLIDKGADINTSDNEIVTPLHRMICVGYFEMVQLLIKNGANVNTNNKSGYTPLHTACTYGPKTRIAKLLVESGADVNIKNNEGQTALDLAKEYSFKESHDEIIELLKL